MNSIPINFMIGFFTNPYPDELLYSALARYSDRVRYRNRKNVLLQFFGSDKISAMFDLPTRLKDFVSSLPEESHYETNKIISQHTLLPFYEPFLPSEKSLLIRHEMATSTENKIHSRLGTRIKQIKNPDYLRFCPVCLNEDKANFGETYWHRIHQLTGIIICPKHYCFLENSSLCWDTKLGYYFFSAEKFIRDVSPRYINSSNEAHQTLLKLSRDAEWLLSQDNLVLGTEILRQRYFNHLLKLGFAYYNGNLRRKKIFDAFDKIFPSKLLEMIGRISKSDNWILALVHKGNTNITYHPIRHLLLITFLGISAEEFFNSYVEFTPFGPPPYPCLNSASNHFSELKVQECTVLDNISKKSSKQGIPIGIFRCDCGFIYQRLGPDQDKKDKFKYNFIKEYGKVWEDKLAELWVDLNLSQAQIAKRLQTSQTSIGRHAIRLKLPMNIKGARTLQGYNRHRNPRNSFSLQIQTYRSEWLIIRQTYPNLSRHQLLKIANFLYLWLSKHDAEWFAKHIPEIHRNPCKKERLDWREIDKKLSEKVKTICDEILNINSFPKRISITEIMQRTGHRGWIHKRAKKLPATNKIITDRLESSENFMIRKILWAREQFIEQCKIPSIPQLKQKAAVRNKTAENSQIIQQLIKSSINHIRYIFNETST